MFMCGNHPQGRAPHPMAQFTKYTRMPLERAIEVVEEVLEPAGYVLLRDLKEAVKADAPEAEPMLDHTIQVMIRGGYVRRVHLGPDRLAYEKTERWASRNDTLVFIRAPEYKKRFRPRVKGKLVRPSAPTVDSAKQFFAAALIQAELFGGDA